MCKNNKQKEYSGISSARSQKEKTCLGVARRYRGATP